MDYLMKDFKLGLRSLRRNKGSSFVIIATLAIAMSAVTTSFSLANGVLLRALPWKDADRIVALSAQGPNYSFFNLVPIDALRELQRSARSFEQIVALQEGQWTVTEPGEPEAFGRTSLDSSAFLMIGAAPAKGRLFSADEYRMLAPVVLISDQLWRNRFAGREDIVGQTMRVNGESRTVIGVMPPGFGFYVRSHLWVPLDYTNVDTATALEDRQVQVLAKLRPGVSLVAAQREVDLIGQRLAASDARFKRWSLRVRDDAVDRQSGGWKMISAFLVGATLLLLLLPCANIATIMLARANERRGETLMRIALGASRRRLIQRALVESLVLSLISSVLALLLTAWALPLIDRAVRSPGMPLWITFGIDWRVLAFTVLAAVFATIAFGLTPALASTKLDLASGLKSGQSGRIGSQAIGAGTRIVIAELAITFVLLIGAGLMLRSWFALNSVEPGYDADRVLHMVVLGSLPRYQQSWQRVELVEQIGERASSDKRIAHVARRGYYTLMEPRSRSTNFPLENGLYLADDPSRSRSKGMQPWLNQFVISDNYFATLGIRINEGRGFDNRDAETSTPTAIVSATLAQKLWPGVSAIGKTARIGAKGKTFEIIGVAADTRVIRGGSAGFNADPGNDIYISDRQGGAANTDLFIRPTGDTKPMVAAIVAAAKSVEPELSPPIVMTMTEEQHKSLLIVQVLGSVVGGVAIIALLLAMIGIAGVIGYQVTQRTSEIGIRMALGGSPSQIVWLITRQGMRLTTIGVSLGAVLALLASGLIRRVTFGVSMVDPLTYVLIAVVIASISVLACYFPARRAARVDPLLAMRSE